MIRQEKLAAVFETVTALLQPAQGQKQAHDGSSSSSGSSSDNSLQRAKHTPTLLDADDMLSDPSLMVQAYCLLTGLPYSASMLSWKPGPVHAWDTWPGWHDDALMSSGLQQRKPKPPPSVDESFISSMLSCFVWRDSSQSNQICSSF